MTRISPEEKRREASDWLRGLIGLVIILGALLIGYMVFQNSKTNLTQQNEKIPVKAVPVNKPTT